MPSRLWFDRTFRRAVRAEIRRLGPWYHQLMLLPGLWTRPWNQATVGELIHAERGGPKFRRFILPLIRPYLKGATVVELGCNAGQMLVCCLRAGATTALGIEPEYRYHEQSLLVRQCLGLQKQLTVYSSFDGIEDPGPGAPIRAELGLMCAVMRHVDPLRRVGTLERMGRICSRILIQGSGLPDAPDGDSVQSILRDVERANLQVEELRSEPHVRGLRMLVRSA